MLDGENAWEHFDGGGRPFLRALYGKLDALAVMIEYEHDAYFQWLQAPEVILRVISEHFEPQYLSTGRGKLWFVGKPK